MTVAVIGGSGFTRWERFETLDHHDVATPYATRPVRVLGGRLDGQHILFLARHGPGHSVAPHRINYRANIRALRDLGASAVLGLATVGGITPAAVSGALMLPDQILDYTWGRAHTFYDGTDGVVAHVDMSEPYCEALRGRLLDAARTARIDVLDGGSYAATQGPRFETPAEVRRLERDGADVVGMTGMPEAALARECQLAYAGIVMIVNPAAGKAPGGIAMEQVRQWQATGRAQAERLLTAGLPMIRDATFSIPPPLFP